MSRFISSGTVKLGLAPESESCCLLFLAPAERKTIDHGHEKYAVFLPEPQTPEPRQDGPDPYKPKFLDAKIVKLPKDKHIEISVQGCFKHLRDALVQAAMHSTNVDIIVEIADDNAAKLQGAVLPAKPHSE